MSFARCLPQQSGADAWKNADAPAATVAKGAEFGHFQFGGSDIVVLLGPEVHAEVDTSDHFRRVGTPAVRCRTAGTAA